MLELCVPRAGAHCDRLSRRKLLEVGGLSVAGLSLSGLLRAEAATPRVPGTAKSCIIIYLDGGPSHLDMWDMKPNAPVEIRGEFKPIPTNVDGIQLSEHLPRLAKRAPEFSLLRSVHHSVVNAHGLAVYCSFTGDDTGPGIATQRDYPAIGSVVGRIRPPETRMVPYVALPYRVQEGAGGPPQPGFYGGWMGQQYDPLYIEKDPNAPDFSIPELTPPSGYSAARMDIRRNLFRAVNGRVDALRRQSDYTAMDSFQSRALELISSPETRKAFQIQSEPDKLRESYGRNIYGQSTLLARRLVEAGTRVVTVAWAPHANATWDTHGSNFASLKNTLLPQLDACLSSLLADLKDRGMLEETLVVCMGEFGRTPKINAGAGRDHWPGCYTLLMAGAGVRGGRVVGKSDETGAEPAENPLTPQDVISTIYQLLGVSPDTEFPDRLNRPLRVMSGVGRFIQELV